MAKITALTPEPTPHMTSTHIENTTDDYEPSIVPQYELIDVEEWRDVFDSLTPGDVITVETSRRVYRDVTVSGKVDAKLAHGGAGLECDIPGSTSELRLFFEPRAKLAPSNQGTPGPVEDIISVEESQ